MSSPRDIRADLESGASETLVRLGERLERECPVPSAGFRGQLRRHLFEDAAAPERPPRRALLIAAYSSSGLSLLLIAAASAAGFGPLAA